MRGSGDTKVRGTECQKVAGLTLGGATLHDVSGQEATLRESKNVKLTLEVRVL